MSDFFIFYWRTYVRVDPYQGERKRTLEVVGEMKAMVVEGQRKLEEKKRKRQRKELESEKRVEAGQQVLEQMAVQVSPQTPNTTIHLDKN